LTGKHLLPPTVNEGNFLQITTCWKIGNLSEKNLAEIAHSAGMTGDANCLFE